MEMIQGQSLSAPHKSPKELADWALKVLGGFAKQSVESAL